MLSSRTCCTSDSTAAHGAWIDNPGIDSDLKRHTFVRTVYERKAFVKFFERIVYFSDLYNQEGATFMMLTIMILSVCSK